MTIKPYLNQGLYEVTVNGQKRNIPIGWSASTIQNIFDSKKDHRGIAPLKVPKSENSIPLFTARIVKNGHIEPFDEFIDPDNYIERCKRGQVQPGDLIFTTEAPMGNVAICPNVKAALGQRMIAFNDSKNISAFFKFNFLSSYSRTILNAHATGSTVLGIKSSTLAKIELIHPEPTEQNLIANLLDEQEKIISSLETQVKLTGLLLSNLQQELLLGKKRIKLNPVKIQELLSKGIINLPANGSDPLQIHANKHDEFASLIDLRFDIDFYENHATNWGEEEVNESKRPIPLDWEIKPLTQKVEFIKGKPIPENQLNYSGNGIKYLKTTEFWLDSASKRDTVHYTGKVDPKHIKQKDEYVFSLDGFNSKIGEGTLGLVSNEDEGIVSTSFYKLVKNDIYHLVVNVLKSNYVQNFIMRLGEGTTVFHAGKYLNNLQGIFPKSTVEQKILSMIFEKEEKLIDALKEKIKLEEKVFKYLQQELLSGRIRVTTEA